MTWWQYLAWGACGGLVVEGLEFGRAARRAGGRPWRRVGEPELPILIFSVMLRLLLSMVAALAAGLGHQVSGPAGAVAVGIAAPLLLELLGAQVAAVRPDGRVARAGRVLTAPFRRGRRRPDPDPDAGEPELLVPEAWIRAVGLSGEGNPDAGRVGGNGG